MAKLSHTERSEISRKAWRKRKREGGKAKCAFCGKPIFARGVRMDGKPYHKGCAEAKGAGLKPAQVGKNPKGVPKTSKGKCPVCGLPVYRGGEKVKDKWYHGPCYAKAYGPFGRERGDNPRRKISERKRAPRDAFRYFGAEELNPRFKFGPTGFRPPAKWFSKMAQGTSASYFGRKLKALTASQRAKVGQIVGGIWAKYTDDTRFEILRKYEPSAVKALANPSMFGKRTQLLNCPACNGLNPVSRLNVYLRCSTCGAPLRSVRVRHKH